MKNKFRIFILIGLCVSLSLFVNNCSEEPEKKGITLTTIEDSTDGAKAFSAVIMAMGSTDAMGSIMEEAPMKSVNLYKSTTNDSSVNNKTLEALPILMSAVKPFFKFADKNVSKTTLTQNGACGGTGIMNIDDVTGAITIVYDNYNNCSEVLDGTVMITGSTSETQFSITFTLGTASSPYTIEVEDVSKETFVIALTLSGQGSLLQMTSASASINGYMQEQDYIQDVKEKATFSSFSEHITIGSEIIESVTYEVSTMTLNGSVQYAYYNDAEGTTPDYSVSTGFTNLVFVVKEAALAEYSYFSMDGIISHTETPETCFNVTVKIETNEIIVVENSTELPVDGMMTINDTIVIEAGPGGLITVTVNGESEDFSIDDIEDCNI